MLYFPPDIPVSFYAHRQLTAGGADSVNTASGSKLLYFHVSVVLTPQWQECHCRGCSAARSPCYCFTSTELTYRFIVKLQWNKHDIIYVFRQWHWRK